MAKLDVSTRTLTIRHNEIPGYLERTGPMLPGLRRAMPEVRFAFQGYHVTGIRRMRKLSFQQIEMLAGAMPAIYSCIDFITSRIMAFPYVIVTSKGKHNNLSQKRADKVNAVLQGPNQYGHTYRMIMKMFIGDLLKRDLGVIEKAKNPLGIYQQIGVIDSYNMRPNPDEETGQLDPEKSYLEMDYMFPERVYNSYKADEIVWANLNPQSGSFYGLSPIEVLDRIITMSYLADSHEIKVVDPKAEKGGGIVWLGGVDQKIRKEFEERYDMFREQYPNRPVISSGGTTAPTFLSFEEKDTIEYNKLRLGLAEMACSCYGLNLRDIGIQSERGTGGTAEIDDTITMRSALVPRALMLEDILTTGIVRPIGGDDLALKYIVKKDEPLEVKVRAASMALGRGIIRLDEARELYDETLEPYGKGLGDKPFIIAGNQVLLLEDIMAGKVAPPPSPFGAPLPSGAADGNGNGNGNGKQPAGAADNNGNRNTDVKNQRNNDQKW